MPKQEIPLAERARRVIAAKSDSFVELIKVAGLDPARDLRFSNWCGLDFSGLDLRGFDFTGSRLAGCDFDGARVRGARFEAADIKGTNLRKARDWAAYVKAWTPPKEPVGDRHLHPGAEFQDAPFAPEMVVVPSGQFLMGSAEGEGDDDEYLRHKVTMARTFAVGRFAVTFQEWDAARSRAGVNHNPGDADWGRGRRPVIHVSWQDACSYVAWLARVTGKDYRLLSEAEWEYCCRAGTDTLFWWGASISTDQANYNGSPIYGGGPKGEYRKQTVRVDSFAPNPWGLYQVHGNVYEWCADNWHDDYIDNPPSDGSVWKGGDDSLRVLRGGSWSNHPLRLRAADRDRSPLGKRDFDIGFRVARTLSPSSP